MPSDDAELVRRAFDAWNEGGVEAVEQVFDDRIEWHDIPEVPWTGVYRGRAAVSAFLREFESSGVVGLRFDIYELRSVGDQVFVATRVEARGTASGAMVPGTEFFYLWGVSNGKVVRVRVFLDREAALEAVGPEG